MTILIFVFISSFQLCQFQINYSFLSHNYFFCQFQHNYGFYLKISDLYLKKYDLPKLLVSTRYSYDFISISIFNVNFNIIMAFSLIILDL